MFSNWEYYIKDPEIIIKLYDWTLMVPFCGDDTKFEVIFAHRALTYN